MIFGAMRDKALDEMASILFPAVGKLILTEIDNPRAASLDMLNLAVPDRFAPANIYPAPSADEALRIAKEITAPSDLICVTGSLYLVGQIQKILNQRSSNFARQLSCN
jgi:dihydrofolate synthase/folylpolyglutamate synthase